MERKEEKERRGEEKKRRRRRKKEEGKEGEGQVWKLFVFGNFLCDVWNISFVWKLILVGLEHLYRNYLCKETIVRMLVWNFCLEHLFGYL